MDNLSKQRQDVSQSFEDFERIMEDYFAIIPPEVEQFDLEKIVEWEYNDVENSLTFYFADEWFLNELKDILDESPSQNIKFEYNEYDHVDREKLTLTIIGRDGGLL